MTGLRGIALKGILWSSIERFSSQGVQFILGLILARILMPSDYGLIGMLGIFLAVTQLLIDGGFVTALIQKKNRDELDYSTAFYFNLLVAVFFYLLLFLIAPLIADFFNQPQLIWLTRIICLSVLINSFGIVPRAKFTINLDFKSQTKASVISILISGIVGICLAFNGCGVWSLVIQANLKSSIEIIVLWYISKWIPQRRFCMKRFKVMFSFGYKILLSELLNTIFGNAYILIIGKFFSANDLGFFTRAHQISAFPSSNISSIIGRVTFPVLSNLQGNEARLGSAYKKIIINSAIIVFPLMMMLSALAEPIVTLILTEKWKGCIWMIQLLCFAAMLHPIHAINLNIMNVKGRSDLTLKIEIVKKVIIVIILVITVPLGIRAIVIGQVATSFIALGINLLYTKKMIDYGLKEQIFDIIPILLLSFAMNLVIFYSISYLNSNLFKVILGFFEGVIFYISFVWALNIGNIRDSYSSIKNENFIS